MSSRRLQDMSSSRHVFKSSSRRLQCNNFSSSKTSSRRLQDVFARRLQEASSKTKNCYAEDVLNTSSRCLEDQELFAGEEVEPKKNSERWLFAQTAVISSFTKNPDSYPANSRKRNTYNHFCNILRRFDVLPNFPFITSGTCTNITYKHGI